ncbi:MAG: ClpXP protease specificity-enhancing factor [Endozoicomonas sp. (ex Botrylloides leachii)]|nr:ClpXP protease specificity-enhancing factor [Endozoicomonas sp. (ex Botrylloides leachii)]
MTSSRPYMARALYEWILDNNCTPYILVDATREHVEVPTEYVADGQIVLNISPAAVRVLDIGNEILTFEGRFGGRAQTIFVPLDALMAIYAKENGQGMVFEAEESTNEDGAFIAEVSEPIIESPEPPKPPKSGKRPTLKVVK